MESPFDVLGIEPDADEVEVLRAYRRRVKEAHPDHGGSPDEFQRVKEAYERIQSPDDVPAGGKATGTDDPSPPATDDVDPEPDPESEEDTEPSRPDGCRVEYLNYQVLADHGWELDDEDLFEKAAAAGLDADDYGRLLVEPRESLLEAAENRGFAWPYACRGGACTNCAVAVLDGEIPAPTGHILPQEMLDRGIRLSCISAPTTDEAKVVYNVKHLPGLDELRLPPSRFNAARSDD